MEGFLGFDLGLEGVEIEEVLEGTSWGCRQPLSTVHPRPSCPSLSHSSLLCASHTVLPQLLVGPTEGSVSLALPPR